MKRRSLMLAVLLVVAGVPAPSTAGGDDGRPLADAGLDQSATVDSTVYLDGGGSLDPDGEIVGYDWSIETPDGDSVEPADPDAVTTRFVPRETGRYEVQLTVTGDDDRTQADTLYVDVEARSGPSSAGTPTPTETVTPTPTPGPSGTDGPTGTPAPAGSSTPVDSSPADSNTDAPAPDPNRPPSGEIAGPSVTTDGSAVSYTIHASDADGDVVEHWWLPTSLARSPAGQSDLRNGVRSLTVDGTPGSTATVSAILVDDDGATTTVRKEVEIRNSLPSASIEGPDMAAVNTTEAYRVVASDPDGEIASVSLASGSGAVEAVGSTTAAGGDWARSFRFTEIPERDGTVTIEATVRDEHGGVTRVEKEVTVISEVDIRETLNPTSQNTPEVLSLDLSIVDREQGVSGRQLRLSAVARDNDSNRLNFDWRVGESTLLENRDSGSPVRTSVLYSLNDVQFSDGSVEVTVEATDQNGNSRQLTREFEVQRRNSGGGTYGRANPIEIMSIEGRSVFGEYHMDRVHAGKSVVIGFGDGELVRQTLGDANTHYFSHRYETGGRYQISLSPGWARDDASLTVDVDRPTYTVWTYERNRTEVRRTRAAESPGEDWTQDSLARIEREQIGNETMRTLARGGKAVTSPSDAWTRVGTTTEYRTERRTTRGIEPPGEDWRIADRNVDRRQVFDGWDYQTVTRRGMLHGDWEFVETVERTVERTETTESTDRPGGDGWRRGEAVGETQDGYSTRWVDYEFAAAPHWEQAGYDTYVSGYDETTVCVDRRVIWGESYCIEHETEREPIYDTRYEYHVPEYSTVYEWDRTVESTQYEYRYRRAMQRYEAVHEYERDVRVGTQYIEWERPVYDRTEIHWWQTETYTWEGSRSFTEPSGDVRNVTKTVSECGTAPSEQEPSICEGTA